ncbi:MAG TPA: hypothetical protein DIW52_08110 [Pseudomonas sp.]|nr:hypothetical protein [Pseudomonas sp.]
MIYGLLLLSVSFGLQAADSDTCSNDIKSLENIMNSYGPTNDIYKLVTENIKQAKAAQASGDNEKCIAITSMTLAKLKHYNK